jgi:phosphoribosyl 1,2-cyclic phosphodiesterase
MPARFAVLASGSSGNCVLLQSDKGSLLIDIGLGPRLIAARLAAVGASWEGIQGVLLTHTHTDHWKDLTLSQLRQRKIPIYCHPRHHLTLSRYGAHFDQMIAAGLVRSLETEMSVAGFRVQSFVVPHDSDPTYAFRIDGPEGLFGPLWSIGYASDLGAIPEAVLEGFTGVSHLAIEFNHDVRMEQSSGRPRILIERVLSDLGHLSNEQAAQGVQEIVRRSGPGVLKHLVQLHLSRHCNKPTLAAKVGQDALRDLNCGAVVTVARQDVPSAIIALDSTSPPKRPKPLAAIDQGV